MIAALRKLLGRSQPAPAAAIPEGQRAYAIGDIHGRADLLAALIAAIDAEDAAAPRAQTLCILLGDLIDRGADSAGVLALAQQWGQRRPLRILMGNHEEMLLGALDNVDTLRHLLRHGGRETVLSFGVDPQTYGEATYDEVQAMLHAFIPAETIAFIRSFEKSVTLGDYHFVHAGIRPGVALADQREEDLRWIREPFLSSLEAHGAVVVHGHTISAEPVLRHNRIGIDTGAYESGRLTALGLEGSQRWLLEACMNEDGAITVERRAA